MLLCPSSFKRLKMSNLECDLLDFDYRCGILLVFALAGQSLSFQIEFYHDFDCEESISPVNILISHFEILKI